MHISIVYVKGAPNENWAGESLISGPNGHVTSHKRVIETMKQESNSATFI